MRKLKHLFSFLFLLLFSFAQLFAQATEYGMASYYGDEFHGSETASGERYNKDALTAAHKTLPMGTRVRVTRVDNKEYVDVVINDRGPYLKGRVIDLSGRAADELGMKVDGTTQVQIDVIGKGSTRTSAPKKQTSPPVATTRTDDRVTTTLPPKKTNTSPPPARKPSSATKKPEVYTAKGRASNTTKGTSSSKQPREDEGFELVVPKNFSEYGLYKIELQKPENAGFGVQVASLSSYSNVLKQVAELQGKWFRNILLSIERGSNNQPIYKVILGPFPDHATAQNYQKNARKKGVKGFVTSLENIEY